MKNIILLVVLLFVTANAQAFETTELGKIISTQGHEDPNCRTVQFRDNVTNAVKPFRIEGGEGGADIMAVTLSALMADRDVKVSYELGVTSGCGPQDRILFITIF